MGDLLDRLGLKARAGLVVNPHESVAVGARHAIAVVGNCGVIFDWQRGAARVDLLQRGDDLAQLVLEAVGAGLRAIHAGLVHLEGLREALVLVRRFAELVAHRGAALFGEFAHGSWRFSCRGGRRGKSACGAGGGRRGFRSS